MVLALLSAVGFLVGFLGLHALVLCKAAPGPVALVAATVLDAMGFLVLRAASQRGFGPLDFMADQGVALVSDCLYHFFTHLQYPWRIESFYSL